MTLAIHRDPYTQSPAYGGQQKKRPLRNPIPSQPGTPFILGHDQIGYRIDKNKPNDQCRSHVGSRTPISTDRSCQSAISYMFYRYYKTAG
jgi:glycosidase